MNTAARPPTKAGFPLGTRRINGNGYITVRCAGGLWESEGRLVVERILGRRLHDDEEIRHKAPTPPWDNREEHLELWRRGRPARLPRRAAPRTNWKGLYTAAIAELERAFPDGAPVPYCSTLTREQTVALQRVLEDPRRP